MSHDMTLNAIEIDELKIRINILRSLLALALPSVEEMASLTDSADDAALAAEIKEVLSDE